MIRGPGPKKPNRQQRYVKRKPIPFLRVRATIKVESTSETLESRVFLNDLSPTGIGCFVNTPIDIGQKVAVVLEKPKQIYLNGEIIWCAPYAHDSKVLSAERYNYRVGIKLIFDSPEQAEIVKQYIDDIYATSRTPPSG